MVIPLATPTEALQNVAVRPFIVSICSKLQFKLRARIKVSRQNMGARTPTIKCSRVRSAVHEWIV